MLIPFIFPLTIYPDIKISTKSLVFSFQDVWKTGNASSTSMLGVGDVVRLNCFLRNISVKEIIIIILNPCSHSELENSPTIKMVYECSGNRHPTR